MDRWIYRPVAVPEMKSEILKLKGDREMRKTLLATTAFPAAVLTLMVFAPTETALEVTPQKTRTHGKSTRRT